MTNLVTEAPPERLESRRSPRRFGRAVLAVLVVAAVFAVLWAPVLAGRRTLVGGDLLYNFNPWTSEPEAHAPRNAMVGDPVSGFVPWLGLVRESFGRGELPLWNPYSFSGAPLLANDQSSPFSPFTLLAVLFANPARGLSIAMLSKLWVAGIGMALFLRAIRVRPMACLLGGISYATSAFVVVWLAYPPSSVAALLPWCFAALEWCLRSRRPLALVGTAAAVAAQFLAGHAETSLHLGFALTGYALVRLVAVPERRGRALVGIAAAAVLGSLAAGIQVVPFVAELSHAALFDDRADARAGFRHLDAGAAATWLVPNGRGNPGIDGGTGHRPNYVEATGFAGVGTLTLAVVGLVGGLGRRRARRNEVMALAVLTVVSAAVVYGPLAPVAGRLPLLSVANNARFLVVTIFAVAALGALGLDAVLTAAPGRPRRLPSVAATLLAGACLGGLPAAAVLLARRGARVNDLLPSLAGQVGFWAAVAALALVAAAALLVSAASGAPPRAVAATLVALALAEGLLFAYPYNPRVPPSEVPPRSEAVDWLTARADDGSVAALGLDLLPNSSVTMRVRDVRGADTLINPRVRAYWSKADPGYADSYLYTVLRQPSAPWLAAAGVAYVMTPNDKVIGGTQPVYQRGGITISHVAGRRPFAFAAPSTVSASSMEDAADQLALDPLGPVVVERAGPSQATLAAGEARVEVASRSNQEVVVAADSPAGARVVVLQSFAPGWEARVDGRSVPLEAANVLFQSAEVPPGPHTVTFRYRPRSVRLGIAATAAGLLGMALVALAPATRRGRRSGHAGSRAGTHRR